MSIKPFLILLILLMPTGGRDAGSAQSTGTAHYDGHPGADQAAAAKAAPRTGP